MVKCWKLNKLTDVGNNMVRIYFRMMMKMMMMKRMTSIKIIVKCVKKVVNCCYVIHVHYLFIYNVLTHH